MEAIFSKFSILEISICGLATLVFLAQVLTYCGYLLIAKHRHHSRLAKGETPLGVTVVVVMENNPYFLENSLPKLLDQNYEGEWEVVVVNDCGGSEIQNALTLLAVSHPRLHPTTIRSDDKFKHSRKIPLLIGIKAAKYPNIIIADPSANPDSEKWLSLMARGLVGGDLVIGYTGFESKTNGLVRAWNFMIALRYLRAAVVGTPYRGIYNNIGYTKDLFFKARGFTHLRLSTGEDDLFVQKVVPYCQHSVILNPSATMRQVPYGGFSWWWHELRYRSYSFRYYPMRVKFSIFFELFAKFLLFGLLVWTAFLWPSNIWIYVLSLFCVREFVMLYSMGKVAKRVGEGRLILPLMLYDLISPFVEAVLAVSRRIKPSSGLWK